MPEDIALFIDFENIRYSMLNIQRREPDPQELIAVARRYGTVMVARAYADWSRQPEPFKGSLTAAMIDRVDCPAKQRDRIRMGTVHYSSGNPPTGGLGSPGFTTEQGTGSYPALSQRQWPTGPTSQSGPLPAITPQSADNGWSPYQEELDEGLLVADESSPEEGYDTSDYQQRESPRHSLPYQSPYGQATPTGPLGQSGTGPLGYSSPGQHTGNTGHLSAINQGGASTIVQSTVVQSTVVVVGIPGTVSRDLISSATHFVPLVPGGSSAPSTTGGLPGNGGLGQMSPSGNTGAMPAISYSAPNTPFQPYSTAPMDVLDPQFLQFLDYIDRNWSWRTIIGVSNFIGDPVNPKNRFRGRLTRESARELLNTCIQQSILILHTDPTGAEDLRLNRSHPGVDEVLKQFVR